jgi:hypothetical protein
MAWQGIEWAVPVFGLSTLVLPIFVAVVYYRRAKSAALSRLSALGRYAALVASPIFAYVLFFFGLVVLEELTGSGLISEGLGRSFLLLVGFGLVVWIGSVLSFGAILLFWKPRPTPPGASEAPGR